MKYRIKPKLSMAIAVMAAGCLAMAQTAHATPTLSIRTRTLTGGFGAAQSYALTAGPSGTFTYSNNAFGQGNALDLSISIQTNAPGTASLAQLVDTSTTIRDNGVPVVQGTVIEITVVDTGYMQPLDPVANHLILSTALNGTQIAGTGGFSGGTIAGSVLANSSQIASANSFLNLGTGTDFFSNTISPFTIRNVITLTLGASFFGGTQTSIVNAVGSVSVNDPTPAIATPEPATTALAISGFGTLVLAGLRRRVSRKVCMAA